MSKTYAALLAALLGAAPLAQATPTTFVDAGATYRYKTLTTDLWPSWASVGLSTFDTFAAANPVSAWSTGAAAFGSGGGLTAATNWAANSDLALTTTFSVADASAVSGVVLNVAADNGFVIYLNDVLLAKDNAEGYTSYWEYSFTVPSSALVSGTNTLKILAEDHGGASFFDMKLSGTVPEPGSLALAVLALGAGGWVAGRRAAARG